MLVLYERLIKTPLMSLQTGTQVGTTTGLIIDPSKLHVVALYCEDPGIDFSPAVIYTTDIREFSRLGLIINSASDIMPPEDLVRLQEVINYDFELNGMRVIDEHKQKIGKVIDYSIEVGSYFVVKLHVQPPLLQSLSTSERLIDRTQIVSVDRDYIVVKSATYSAAETAKPKKARLQNPFGRPQPGIAKMQNNK